MSDPSLSLSQRRTLVARKAFAERFATPEERSNHFRDLAHRANAGRVTLSADEVEALGEAYALLGRIAARHRAKLAPCGVDGIACLLPEEAGR